MLLSPLQLLAHPAEISCDASELKALVQRVCAYANYYQIDESIGSIDAFSDSIKLIVDGKEVAATFDDMVIGWNGDVRLMSFCEGQNYYITSLPATSDSFFPATYAAARLTPDETVEATVIGFIGEPRS